MGKVRVVGGGGLRLPDVSRLLRLPVSVRSIASAATVGFVLLILCALQSPSAAAGEVCPAPPALTTTVVAPMNATVGNFVERHGHGHGHPDGGCTDGVGRLHLVHRDRTFDALHGRDPGRHRHNADDGRRRLDVHPAARRRPDSDESGDLLLQRRLYGDGWGQLLVGVAAERQRVLHGLPGPSGHAGTHDDGGRPDERHRGEFRGTTRPRSRAPRRGVHRRGRSPSPCAPRPNLRRPARAGSRSAPSQRRRRSATSRRSPCRPQTPRLRRVRGPTATTPPIRQRLGAATRRCGSRATASASRSARAKRPRRHSRRRWSPR